VKSPEWALSAARLTVAVRSDLDFRLAVFRLARHFKAVPELRDRTASALRPLVQQWHESAVDHLGGRTLADTRAEFANAWKGARDPAGDDVVKRAWDITQAQPLPPEAAMYGVKIGRLIALCRQLQFENERDNRRTGFYLGGRRAASLLGVKQPTAAKWLALLVDDGILVVTDEGGGQKGGRRMARSYRMARYCEGRQYHRP
jgi:hypothetical protein